MIQIGVGVFVKRGPHIILGRRGSGCRSGQGLFAIPGGFVEQNETIAEACVREVKEETGLNITMHCQKTSWNHDFILGVTDQTVFGTKQILTLWCLGHWLSGEPEVKEPTKHLFWKWLEPKLYVCGDRRSKQYEWTPRDLWERILPPYFEMFK